MKLLLWNKAKTPVTVFGVSRAEAAGQALHPRDRIGAGFGTPLDETTLGVGGKR
ncbi:MAG: hypothetical protein ACT4PO_05560 [Actinomycetota bacterium]